MTATYPQPTEELHSEPTLEEKKLIKDIVSLIKQCSSSDPPIAAILCAIGEYIYLNSDFIDVVEHGEFVSISQAGIDVSGGHTLELDLRVIVKDNTSVEPTFH